MSKKISPSAAIKKLIKRMKKLELEWEAVAEKGNQPVRLAEIEKQGQAIENKIKKLKK